MEDLNFILMKTNMDYKKYNYIELTEIIVKVDTQKTYPAKVWEPPELNCSKSIEKSQDNFFKTKISPMEFIFSYNCKPMNEIFHENQLYIYIGIVWECLNRINK